MGRWTLTAFFAPSAGRSIAANGTAWLATYVLPLLAVTGFVGENRSWRRRALTVAVVVIVAAGAAWIVNGPIGLNASAAGEVHLVLEERRASASPASDLFVIDGTHGNDDGIVTLIGLMAKEGTLFYRSGTAGSACGPSGRPWPGGGAYRRT